MKIEEKTILWKPVSEYTGGRVLATNGLDILIGELKPEGDCVSEDCSGIHLCGITHFAKIDGFFPELAESEDERIRKALIATIHLYYGEPLEDEAKEMIAWLEKQGSQILANSAKTCKDEQQPTDNDMKELLHTEYEKGRADAIAEMQKPAWSVEDEEELDIAISTLKEAGQHDSAEWLKSLKSRVQPKQEWGEEDEEMFEKILQQFTTANNDCKLNNASFTYDKEISFLKSLKDKHTWDPSDEQMEALQYVYRNLNPPLSDKLGWNSLKTLELMYQDLKKLKR